MKTAEMTFLDTSIDRVVIAVLNLTARPMVSSNPNNRKDSTGVHPGGKCIPIFSPPGCGIHVTDISACSAYASVREGLCWGKKPLCGIIACAAFFASAPAIAADVSGWTGFYFGAAFDGGWTHLDVSQTSASSTITQTQTDSSRNLVRPVLTRPC